MLLSIITVNLNNVDGLRRTIESVKKQEFSQYEFIIIDGDSSDDSSSLIKESSKYFSNYKYLIEPDNGLYFAMNKGIDLASGNYCIFMNSGDEFYNSKSIKYSVRYLEDKKYDIVSGVATIGKIIWHPAQEKDISLAFFLRDNMSHQSTYIRTNLIRNNKYNTNYKIVADHDMFFNLMIMKNCSYLPIPVYVCTCEPTGISGDLQKSMEERFFAISRYFPNRISRDINFISKYHNPVIIAIGKIIKQSHIGRVYRLFKNMMNMR